VFRNLGYKLERIFRDPGLEPGKKKTLTSALVDNQEFIYPSVIFTTEKQSVTLNRFLLASDILLKRFN